MIIEFQDDTTTVTVDAEEIFAVARQKQEPSPFAGKSMLEMMLGASALPTEPETGAAADEVTVPPQPEYYTRIEYGVTGKAVLRDDDGSIYRRAVNALLEAASSRETEEN
jgi:hypothetical protein